MKKICLLIIMIFIMLVSSACASADLTYTLTEDNKTVVQYAIVFDETFKNVSDYINEIGAYWAGQGMSIYVDQDQKSVSGEETTDAKTAKEAAEAFAALFTSPDSIFRNVSFAYTPSLQADDYSFSADVFLKDVIRQKQAQSIPSDQIEKIEDAAGQGTYRLSVSLPGDVTQTNADACDGNVCTWTLDYGKTSTLHLQTQKQNAKAVQDYNKLTSIIDNNNMLIIICACTAGFCVLAIVASVIVRRVKRKRASEVRVKHFR